MTMAGAATYLQLAPRHLPDQFGVNWRVKMRLTACVLFGLLTIGLQEQVDAQDRPIIDSVLTQQFRELELSWTEAIVSQDLTRIEAFLAPDFRLSVANFEKPIFTALVKAGSNAPLSDRASPRSRPLVVRQGTCRLEVRPLRARYRSAHARPLPFGYIRSPSGVRWG